MRQIDRETERRRKERAASEAPTVTKRASPHDGVAPKLERVSNVGRQRHGRKAWTNKPAANPYAYKGDWPERRVRVLERDGYACQLHYADICVGRASQVDHIVQPEAGGGSDPPI